VALALALAGCHRPPSADSLPEWTPADHHSNDDDKLAAQGPAQRGPASPRPSRGDVTQLVDLTWRQQCITCHGPMGRGDGQLAPMVHPPDLTDAKWQGEVSDGEMRSVIKNGKNRMPKFDLPDPVLEGLVARVRSLRGR
jgi:cytochrome c oxidase cbb3-type subunit 3